ncbi:OmpA family protein [Coleofasciculus sp. FACHB-64]|uniref:OmpA family protein n=1 Tax=Cyanophyceae TaxID=3028117 RepID=UPI001685183B|nr:OmpA family protein [Coleofasciculus sp. FACHB-501]MBD2044193.1 OmpA family protein [Coleofasciculus sp. FACHB-64]
MTKQEAPFADNTSPRQSTGIGRFLLVLLWRVLLLGVGGGLAWLFGLVLAGVFPDLTPEVPLVVKVLRRAKLETSTASSTFKPSPAVTSASPPVELSAEQRRQLEAELQQLQAQLQALRDRTTKLETQVGRQSSSEPLAARLQEISQQLQGDRVPNSNQVTTASRVSLPSDALKVTLPSDLLFKDSDSVLLPQAPVILDNVIADLRNYPGATIQIAAHTDDNGEATDNQALSFRRAQAAEQYLFTALEKKYRMIVVGYGESFSLVENNSDTNRQRNRRIEIAIINP